MKLLLTGNPGVGKTTICRLVAEQLGEQPFTVYRTLRLER
jgi:nucleoside-triphosphatase THEP1